MPAFNIATLIAGAVGVLCTIGGTTGQLVSLNFWLASFPGGAGPFTVLLLVSTTLAVLFGCGLSGWSLLRRPKLKFGFTRESVLLLCGCGLCFALNGVLIVFATPGTPELLQAMLFSTSIFWTFVAAGIAELAKTGLQSFRVMDRRAIAVPIAFFLCTAGVIVGAGGTLKFNSLTSAEKKWTALFALGMIPGSVFNVLAGHYMSRFSESSAVSIVPAVVTGQSFRSNDLLHHNPAVSDPTTVKAVMLFGSSLFQVLWLCLFFPLDWTPGYGASHDAHGAVHNLGHNIKCVFFGTECSNGHNFAYYMAFALSYAASYIGGALLNQISAPICSMVTQLATPASALALIIVPKWNISGQSYNLASCLIALGLITAGSTLYVYWARFMQSPEALVLAGDVDMVEEEQNARDDALLRYAPQDAADTASGSEPQHVTYGSVNAV